MLFMMLSFVQMALISFVAPGLTAGVISGERERQTLNILLTTQQSSTSIIIGKLVSSLAFLMLIVLATLPLYSLVFLFGGISPQQLLQTFGLFVVTMFILGSMGVFFSTLIRKTMIAMITTYGLGFVHVFRHVFNFDLADGIDRVAKCFGISHGGGVRDGVQPRRTAAGSV